MKRFPVAFGKLAAAAVLFAPELVAGQEINIKVKTGKIETSAKGANAEMTTCVGHVDNRVIGERNVDIVVARGDDAKGDKYQNDSSEDGCIHDNPSDRAKD